MHLLVNPRKRYAESRVYLIMYVYRYFVKLLVMRISYLFCGVSCVGKAIGQDGCAFSRIVLAVG